MGTQVRERERFLMLLSASAMFVEKPKCTTKARSSNNVQEHEEKEEKVGLVKCSDGGH